MSPRQSKWERKANPGRLILQPRDKEIMVALYAFRLLSREQIQSLFGFNCLRRGNARLRKLYDHQYLSRSFLPTIRGSSKAVYCLGPQGALVVGEELGLDPKAVRKSTKKISQLKELFLTHALELNDIRIAFSQAIQNHPEMSLERWLAEDECGRLRGRPFSGLLPALP